MDKEQAKLQETPKWFFDLEADILKAQDDYEKAKEKLDSYKKIVLAKMEENGLRCVGTDLLECKYTNAYLRTSVDSKKLQAKYPEVFNDVTIEKKVSPSVRIISAY